MQATIKVDYIVEIPDSNIESVIPSLLKICHNAGIPGEVCILFDKSSQKHRYLYSNLHIFSFSSTFITK